MHERMVYKQLLQTIMLNITSSLTLRKSKNTKIITRKSRKSRKVYIFFYQIFALFEISKYIII
jgi:hypothetical protein